MRHKKIQITYLILIIIFTLYPVSNAYSICKIINQKTFLLNNIKIVFNCKNLGKCNGVVTQAGTFGGLFFEQGARVFAIRKCGRLSRNRQVGFGKFTIPVRDATTGETRKLTSKARFMFGDNGETLAVVPTTSGFQVMNLLKAGRFINSKSSFRYGKYLINVFVRARTFNITGLIDPLLYVTTEIRGAFNVSLRKDGTASGSGSLVFTHIYIDSFTNLGNISVTSTCVFSPVIGPSVRVIRSSIGMGTQCEVTSIVPSQFASQHCFIGSKFTMRLKKSRTSKSPNKFTVSGPCFGASPQASGIFQNGAHAGDGVTIDFTRQ